MSFEYSHGEGRPGTKRWEEWIGKRKSMEDRKIWCSRNYLGECGKSQRERLMQSKFQRTKSRGNTEQHREKAVYEPLLLPKYLERSEKYK